MIGAYPIGASQFGAEFVTTSTKTITGVANVRNTTVRTILGVARIVVFTTDIKVKATGAIFNSAPRLAYQRTNF